MPAEHGLAYSVQATIRRPARVDSRYEPPDQKQQDGPPRRKAPEPVN